MFFITDFHFMKIISLGFTFWSSWLRYRHRRTTRRGSYFGGHSRSCFGGGRCSRSGSRSHSRVAAFAMSTAVAVAAGVASAVAVAAFRWPLRRPDVTKPLPLSRGTKGNHRQFLPSLTRRCGRCVRNRGGIPVEYRRGIPVGDRQDVLRSW